VLAKVKKILELNSDVCEIIS